MTRRRRLIAGLACTLVAPAVLAQAERPPLRILVGFPPGGSADTIARLLAERLREPLGGQTAVVDNKPGAAGRIAIDALKAAPADGNTVIIMPSGPVVLFPLVFKRLGYDVSRDLAPISQLAGFQFALVSGPKSNVRNVAEMLARVKADPGLANYGTSGAGTVPHFLGVMLGQAAGIELQHVPFQGGAPAMNALMGGHTAFNIDVLSESLEQHRAGKVRIIAVSGAARSPLVPEVPTLREQGVALDASAWFAMYGPGGLAREQALRIQRAVATAMADADLRKRLDELGLEPIASTPEQLAAVQKADLAKWEKPVKATGYQAD